MAQSEKRTGELQSHSSIPGHQHKNETETSKVSDSTEEVELKEANMTIC
jgi:hypothetical protein